MGPSSSLGASSTFLQSRMEDQVYHERTESRDWLCLPKLIRSHIFLVLASHRLSSLAFDRCSSKDSPYHARHEIGYVKLLDRLHLLSLVQAA